MKLTCFHAKACPAAEMKPAEVANKQTQYVFLYPDDLLVESTVERDDEWMDMCYLLVEGRECFLDDLERLERILYDRRRSSPFDSR